MLSVPAHDLEAELQSLVSEDRFRAPKTIGSAQGPEVEINGRRFINFCSNDYLGLANDVRLKQAFKEAVDEFGVGSGASPLVCGHSIAHEELERALAEFTGRDRALIFASGFQTNLAVITALCPNRDDLVVQDRLNHASMIDGAMLARSKLKRYRHRDMDSLSSTLVNETFKRKLVLTDSVFSMDGDVAPLDDIAAICKEKNAWLAVDDAHGFGVLGEHGKGALDLHGLVQADVPLMVATFGKALGASGGFVAGPEVFIETIVQKARPYIYSTAMPPALAKTIMKSLQIVSDESWRRDHLMSMIEKFKAGARELGLRLSPSSTPIQPLVLGESSKAMALSEKLFEQGYFVPAIRPPTVPENTSRLRITFSAAHTIDHVAGLLNSFRQILSRDKTFI